MPSSSPERTDAPLVETAAAETAVTLLFSCIWSLDTARKMSSRALSHFGSVSKLFATGPERLRDTLGLDEATILLITAVQAVMNKVVREPLDEGVVISSEARLLDYLSVVMRHEETEVVRVLFLNSRNRLIKDEVVSRGTVNHVYVYPREVVRRSLELGATAVILVHNHPGGDPSPSEHDIEMTKHLVSALGLVNVILHDHVIVGKNAEVSMRRNKLLVTRRGRLPPRRVQWGHDAEQTSR